MEGIWASVSGVGSSADWVTAVGISDTASTVSSVVFEVIPDDNTAAVNSLDVSTPDVNSLDVSAPDVSPAVDGKSTCTNVSASLIDKSVKKCHNM